MRRPLLGLAAILLASHASAVEVKFSVGPTATRAGEKTAIAFSLSVPADVEVAVLDTTGKVVRHLAAGVLGAKNPPPEPLKPGLAQSLEWDGKDDRGKPAAGGPWKLRVRAGMGVKFGRMIGGSPYAGTLAKPLGWSSVAVDERGRLYVKVASMAAGHLFSHLTPWQIRCFDSSGRYERTVLPYAPSTPPEKTTAFHGKITVTDGLLTPANMSALYPVLYDLGDNIHHRIVDGSLVFVAPEHRRIAGHYNPTHWDEKGQYIRPIGLYFHKLDGTNALKFVPMKLRHPLWLVPSVAFSPDGKYVYYANVAGYLNDTPASPKDIDPAWPDGRVYRQDLSKADGEAEKFYDLELPDWEKAKYPLPSIHGGGSSASDIDVDGKGNVLICDRANGGIVEVSPEGKKLSFTPVGGPGHAVVGRKDGTLYVLSSSAKPGSGHVSQELIKVIGRGADARIAARMPIPFPWGACGLAVDESGAAPVVWLYDTSHLMRIEDQGATLAAAKGSVFNSDNNGSIAFLQYMAADPETDALYVTSHNSLAKANYLLRFDGNTGEGGATKFNAMDVAIGPDGAVYLNGVGRWEGPIGRFTRDLAPLLLEGGKNEFGSAASRFGRGDSSGGLAVGPDGWTYVFQSIGGNWPSCVYAYDAVGKRVEHEFRLKDGGHDEAKRGMVPVLIGPLGNGGGIRVDRSGNLYIGMYGQLKGQVPQAGFEKDPIYMGSVGTILKFGLKGGNRPDHWSKYDPNLPMGFSGVLGTYAGYGLFSGGAHEGGCICQRPRFDIDRYDRLYIPETVTYQVSVRDNNDNVIVRFGGYGNFDAQGPQSKEPKPKIPLGWANLVCASDKYIYVGDVLNHRIARVDKTWAAEATCPVGR